MTKAVVRKFCLFLLLETVFFFARDVEAARQIFGPVEADVPKGWEVTEDDEQLTFLAPDKSAALTIPLPSISAAVFVIAAPDLPKLDNKIDKSAALTTPLPSKSPGLAEPPPTDWYSYAPRSIVPFTIRGLPPRSVSGIVTPETGYIPLSIAKELLARNRLSEPSNISLAFICSLTALLS